VPISRDIRRLAFQALFQLDARGDADFALIRASLDDADEGVSGKLADADLDRGFGVAVEAYRSRKASDDAVLALAPTWPAHRQPAVDRAIIRLAYHEMTTGLTPPKVAVNEAVELAKAFGTEKSPGFVNAVLDKVLKQVLSQPAAEGA
jgi:N utilization substance protein B